MIISITTIIRNTDITTITMPPSLRIYGPPRQNAYDLDEYDQFEQRYPDDDGFSRNFSVYL
ncbi:MAG: hypothetical protein IPG67_04450 [Acidobacteria bacterium]|nr:hypothetical protein [Acidobacteriota bacterium]